MEIEHRRPGRYDVVCAQGHKFSTRELGPSVECPHCGETALSADLMMEYTLSKRPSDPPRFEIA